VFPTARSPRANPDGPRFEPGVAPAGDIESTRSVSNLRPEGRPAFFIHESSFATRDSLTVFPHPSQSFLRVSRRGGHAVCTAASPGNDAKLAALLDAIRDAKAVSASRKGSDDAIDARALARRLSQAESENAQLRETVAQLKAFNDDKEAELLEDAATLAVALAKAQDLETEAQALRNLNIRLAVAAEEVASMVVGSDESSSSRTEGILETLRKEAETARESLKTAEANAKADRDALLSKVRALETALAVTEGEIGDGVSVTGNDSVNPLEQARVRIKGLTLLAEQRGDALMRAEAAAAAEVASLKKQLSHETGSIQKIRELESLVAEMLTQAEADARADVLTEKIRGLETQMAEMLTQTEADARSDVLTRTIRSLETQMAELIDPEEMDALLAHVRAVEARAADMVDADALLAAETRARELEQETDALRGKVRALESEMTQMTYPEDMPEGANSLTKKVRALELEMTQMTYPEDMPEGGNSVTKKVRALESEMATMSHEDDDEASVAGDDSVRKVDTEPASTASKPAETSVPQNGRKQAFVRDPNATFTKRSLTFAAKETVAVAPKAFQRAAPDAFKLRRLVFAPSSRAKSVGPTSPRSSTYSKVKGDPVVYTFDDAVETPKKAVTKKSTANNKEVPSKKKFTRASPDQFILRKLSFPSVRATAVPTRLARPAFKRDRNATFTKRRLVFTDPATKTEIELDNVPVEINAAAAFERNGTFTLRRFQFSKAKAAAEFGSVNSGKGAGTGAESKQGFKRTPPSAFTLRRFKFHP
jgi:hypothetical protein